ncbi:outer membrane porin GjpA [Mycobacterium malmoense]|uniref:PE-PGRS family protein n=1 Tax=Mycobacterium malmoense TaxID=1780 RepID=A0ABX3SKZ5_MYCMA|nr:outer membrane porin GjpA [Mycobacterium malmoense]ORA77028.1 hypothetical protein BST29_24120 [Mycobacterium malmoense]QZA16687.1 outer membrane porin GjpA [Mycobacterium malmoense]UNB93486.1 outer membrane porin GjpA [Mycobacterium malmoense]
MELTTRPWITASVALAGASVIALTPTAPCPPEVHISAVALTDSFDFITPWIDTFNNASSDTTELFDHFFQAPLPALQQVLVNQADYLDSFVQNPANIGDVLTQIGDNLQNTAQTMVLAGAPKDIVTATLPHTMEAYHLEVYNLLPFVLQDFLHITNPTELQAITAVVNLMSSPPSGVLIGAAGPFVSPVVELSNDIQNILGALSSTTPNFGAALSELINIPASLTNAFFNGATLNLSAILPLLSQSGVLPSGIDFTYLGIAFGGLLTPGITNGDYPNNLGIGGSLFNSLAFSLDKPLAVTLGGVPTGPLGALENLSQILADTLGWNTTGNPLTQLSFPLIPTDLTTILSTDLTTTLNNNLTGLAAALPTQLSTTLLTELTTNIPHLLLSLLGI